jgi:uncharacterized phage protein (TIGR01671 family)
MLLRLHYKPKRLLNTSLLVIRGGTDMREIKFRAWDDRPNGKCMLDWITINQTAFNFKADRPLLWTIFHTPGIVLMQYTGLRDKNGKEIYEGDIVKFYKNERHYVGEIKFENGCFDIIAYAPEPKSWRGKVFVGGILRGFQSVEVIGNIYEHPELLEVCT